MNNANQEEMQLRRFLLGELGEDERQHVEEQFVVDPEYRERVLAAEDDLIEDYAEGSLSEAERRQVVARILSTPDRRQKLRTALLIKTYVKVETAAHSPPMDEKIERLERRYAGARGLRRPYVFVPLAAALLIALGFGVLKLVELKRQNELRAREQARREAVERELARLNDASAAGPAAPYSVTLAPVFVRGLKAAPEVSPPAGADVVELRLVLVGGGYETYRAVLQKLDDPTPLTIPGLRAKDSSGQQTIHLKIPARLLTRGDYQVGLSGLGAGGRYEETGEYNFRVTD